MSLVHGTCIAIDTKGVLLRGAPGSGKSDLALRLLGLSHLGAKLVADDQVQLTRRGDELWAQAPAKIAELLEVRGVGIVRLAALGSVRLCLVLDLCASSARDMVPRLPEAGRCTIDGIGLPLYPCSPFEASAPDKVALLLRSLDEDILRP
jgi:HPr kinase/phosphorylase